MLFDDILKAKKKYGNKKKTYAGMKNYINSLSSSQQKKAFPEDYPFWNKDAQKTHESFYDYLKSRGMDDWGMGNTVQDELGVPSLIWQEHDHPRNSDGTFKEKAKGASSKKKTKQKAGKFPPLKGYHGGTDSLSHEEGYYLSLAYPKEYEKWNGQVNSSMGPFEGPFSEHLRDTKGLDDFALLDAVAAQKKLHATKLMKPLTASEKKWAMLGFASQKEYEGYKSDYSEHFGEWRKLPLYTKKKGFKFHLMFMGEGPPSWQNEFDPASKKAEAKLKAAKVLDPVGIAGKKDNHYFITTAHRITQNDRALPSHMQRAWTYYTGSSYRDFNEVARSGFTKNVGTVKKEIASNLMAAFKEVEPLKKPIVVWRGLDIKGDIPPEWEEEGAAIAHYGFASTSFSPVTAKNFGRFVMRTVIPRGSRVIIGNEDELEVLLPPGAVFKVERRLKSVPGVYISEYARVYDCRISFIKPKKGRRVKPKVKKSYQHSRFVTSLDSPDVELILPEKVKKDLTPSDVHVPNAGGKTKKRPKKAKLFNQVLIEYNADNQRETEDG